MCFTSMLLHYGVWVTYAQNACSVSDIVRMLGFKQGCAPIRRQETSLSTSDLSLMSHIMGKHALTCDGHAS